MSGPGKYTRTTEIRSRISLAAKNRKKRTMAERFEEKVERIPECGCWIWMGVSNNMGYGMFHAEPGRRMLSHRMSWEIKFGAIPKGMFVLHRCDTPLCCNPYHLFLGTYLDNNRDCIKKGRYQCGSGERQGNAKLTSSDVLNILQDRRSQRVIAKDYGVSGSAIYSVKKGKTWAHVKEGKYDHRNS